MMMKLADLVASREDWLVHKVLTYAKENGYTRYTSTLAEAWRTSISGLSQSLLECLKSQSSVPELLPDEDYTSDPIATFGIIEAKRHRKRGVSLGMFLGLMKYYRQSYIDLVMQACFGIEEERLYRSFVERFFDRIELGFCTEWNSLTENQMLVELQSANRCITNEKNKYLTIFESISDPVFLFDKENRIENMNHAASELFFGTSVPGSAYYDKQKTRDSFSWIADELTALDASGQMEVIFEKQVITGKGILQFQVKIEQMLDVSEKFSGKVVILNDITGRKRDENALRESERRLADIINFLPDATLVIDKEGKVISWNRAIEAMTGIRADEILGKGDYEYALPFYGERRPILIDLVLKSREEIETRYEYITRSDGILVGESYMPNPKGGEVYLLGSAAALYDSEGNIAGAIESIRDITEHKNTERKLAYESNKFKVLYDLALNMSAEKSLEENMAFIVDKSRELLNTDTSYMALLDETGQHVRMNTLSGIRTKAFKRMHLPLGKGLYGLVMETHKGYIIDDYLKDKDIKHVVDGIIADEGLISGMAVPVQIRDKSLGVLYVFNRRKTLFTQEDLDTLALLGNLAAVEIIRKHSSNALQGQLSFLQQLIDAIPSPIFYKDTWGVYRGCNTAFESFTGLSKDKMVGKTVYDLYPKDLADIYYKADKSLFQNPGVQTYETAMVHVDGTRRNVISNKAAYFDTKGRLAGEVGVILDITERKKAEEKQKESKEYLNKIINSIGDPIFVKDRNHRFVLINDALCNLMGHLREEIIGCTDHDFFPNDQADVFWEKDEIVFESGVENINDELITDAQGTIRDITTKKTLYTDNAGNQFIVGVIRDITNRKRAEDELLETRNYLENLFDYANAPIIVWDPTFRITRFNHAFEHLTGYTAEEVIGQKLDFLFPESSRDLSFSKIERTLAGEYWESVEVPILQKDGTIRIVLWNSANIYAADSKALLATMAQGTDITERKRAEEAIKESERRLADIINFLPDATLVIDRDGRVIAWNRRYRGHDGRKRRGDPGQRRL